VRRSIPFLGDDPDAPFPPAEDALREPDGLLAAGGDLSMPRLLRAYRTGIFPWFMPGEPLLWWSPDPRCVFVSADMHVPRRLRRDLRRTGWRIEADRTFDAVVAACAAPRDTHGGTWIGPDMAAAYGALHRAGHAHSIEVREPDDTLVGGLYGVAIGRMFFAESMYSARPHASKAALLALASRLAAWNYPLIDAQVASSHLFTLGAKLVRREEFLAVVATLVDRPGVASRWTGRFGVLDAAALVDG
jgi:leucyl/phenylalanyl-tRNA---protein transferase